MMSKLESFIEYDNENNFPIQNLPYGIFTIDNGSPRVGVAIGNYVLDLSILEREGYFNITEIKDRNVFSQPFLNNFMEMGRVIWKQVRSRIQELLSTDCKELQDNKQVLTQVLIPMDQIKLQLPVKVSEFTDFYSSYHHAYNVGSMIRGPENAIMPNWKHLPVAYHGRASSVVISDIPINRPRGQIKLPDKEYPTFTETKRLDYELEMGFFIGTGNKLGTPINVHNAKDHIFGMVLVNDWSARDVQVWEYKPLGPFLSKNFATSISPWVVTLDALEDFRIDGMKQKPDVLPYLKINGKNAYDIKLEVSIQSESMNNPKILTKSNAKYLYWNIFQQLAHHSITGCNMQTGDLLGSGTISGKEYEERGCMLELSELGKKSINLTEDETRTFLEDGDTITITGYCQGDGYRIGFGEVKTKILPSINLD
jgi:fumarylacetoacetase